MAGSRGAGQVGAAGDVAGLDVETGDGCQQLVDLIAPHARRHVRLDVVIEPSLGKQTDATDAGADQGPAAAVAGGLIRQGGRGRGAASAAGAAPVATAARLVVAVVANVGSLGRKGSRRHALARYATGPVMTRGTRYGRWWKMGVQCVMNGALGILTVKRTQCV
ncbi:hypothetical protein D3C81_1392330 [compost metagenome]